MALSRLLFTEAQLHFPNTGLSKQRRWFTTPLPQKKVSKRSEAAKERKTEAVKYFLQSYMEKHAGQFPKTKVVQDAIGGSWYILKDILSEMHVKIFAQSAPAVKLREEIKEETDQNSELKAEISERKNWADSIEEKCPKLGENCEQIEGENEQISPLNRGESCPKLDDNREQIEGGIERINPSNGENCPKLERNYLQIEAESETKHIRSSIEESIITPNLLNLIEGLKNGPKSTEIKLNFVKEDQLKDRNLKNGTINKEPKNMQNLVNRFEGLGLHNTSKLRERKRDTFDAVRNILTVITENDTTDKQNRNQRNFQDSFSLLNPNPNPNLNPNPKGEGRLFDFLNKRGGNEKCTEKTESESDWEDSDFLDSEVEEEGPICKENEKCKYGVFVRFLEKNISNSVLCGVIGGPCGPIESSRFLPSKKNDQFKCAVIFFKTEQGFKSAMQMTDLSICKRDVTLEPLMTSALTSSSLPKGRSTDAELAVLDPGFPVNLLKRPSRSVKVNGLTESTSFDRLRVCLERFGPVCEFSMGQSGSTIYVEFESEESCEKALEAAKLKVHGRNLNIFRVYAPKTSVIRISNVNFKASKSNKIQSACGELGKIKRLVQRSRTIFDVHFSVAESPNILKIINRLNGSMVDENQWVVKPSTFIPVGIIQSMWNSEQGRTQLHQIFQSICTKIAVQNATSISPLIRLSQDYTLGFCER